MLSVLLAFISLPNTFSGKCAAIGYAWSIQAEKSDRRRLEVVVRFVAPDDRLTLMTVVMSVEIVAIMPTTATSIGSPNASLTG